MGIIGMTGLNIGEVNKDLQGRIDQIKAESLEKAALRHCAASVRSKPIAAARMPT
jgi:hypothetical protein